MNKYALVTGGSRGIGRAICLQLARMGYYVLINYLHNQKEAQNTLDMVRAAGSDGELLGFDVTDATQTSQCLTQWLNNHKGEYVEVLVNNAGIRKDNVMALMPAADWQQVLDTTLSGFFNTTQPLLPLMQRKRYGRIVNMASVNGMRGMPGQVNYSTAKGGLIAATKALALEVTRRGVTVNAVAPGFIKTDMTDGLDEQTLSAQIPAGRFGNPEEVADLVGFLVSDKAGYISGQVISINGGLYT